MALGRKHNILVQEQPAVEVLARVDVVCFDKTGTLTEGGVIFDSVRPLDTVAEAEGRKPDSEPSTLPGVLLCLPAGMRRWRGLVTMRTRTRPLRL